MFFTNFKKVTYFLAMIYDSHTTQNDLGLDY
jgi:hypothetical protein